ncbi:hypothetical protein ROZALSC1DRAFT_28585 [Rozella allomycis CSF55]|uniref:alpha-1,2-Mannosidase n=1 Tax=Rozella allomycis (strain CSF55) TaxID=988480 RepID=A0A4P9YL20_ROZAC|nr:hypothetical protein ROZALSC1DRAFT_28585 [Rozella allomycis CSF55]
MGLGQRLLKVIDIPYWNQCLLSALYSISPNASVQLDVLPSNEIAIELYKAHDFVVHSFNKDYYTINGVNYDSIKMIRDFQTSPIHDSEFLKLPFQCYLVGDCLEEEVCELPSKKAESDNFGGANRKDMVKRSFEHAWNSYKEYAFGFDHLHPLTQKGDDWFGLGLTIIDSLDTMHIMGLHDEVAYCENWIVEHLNYDNNYDVNLFETTIRVLGSLLSMHHLTGKKLYLDKAVDLADRLLSAWNGDANIPLATIHLKDRVGVRSTFDGGESSTSEVSTLQIEFRYLSYLTGNKTYQEKVDKTMQVLLDLEKMDGLVPIFIRGDSYYEYLIKQFLQTSQTEKHFSQEFKTAWNGIKKHLLKETTKGQSYIGELPFGKYSQAVHPKMDHLVCFLPGSLALSLTLGRRFSEVSLSAEELEDFEIAERLLQTCYEMYEMTETGLAPEIVYFTNEDMYIQPADRHCLLRPETVESLWIMYQITRNEKYREMGWKIFTAIEKFARHEVGYTSIEDVTKVPPPRRDNMESFFLAETLKYFDIYTICSQVKISEALAAQGVNIYGEEVYRSLEELMKKHLTGIKEKLENLMDVELLREYGEQWRLLIRVSKVVSNMFSYINRYWVSRQIGEKAEDVFLISTMIVVLWRKEVFEPMKTPKWGGSKFGFG